jgi:hypothetical protein
MSTVERQFPTFEAVRPLELFTRFKQSDYGQILQSSTRFGRFQGQLDQAAWEDLLGADVNNGQHMKLMYGMTRLFVTEHNALSDSEHQLSSDEQELLCVAAAIHDQAEAIVGDIPAPHKKGTDHEEEMEILVDLIHSSDFDENVKNVCLKAVQEVIRDSSTKLGHMWAVIEQIGYMRTGIRDWNIYTSGHYREGGRKHQRAVRHQLRMLAGDVKFHTLPRLEEAAKQYPVVKLFLQENVAVISQMPSMKYIG